MWYRHEAGAVQQRRVPIPIPILERLDFFFAQMSHVAAWYRNPRIKLEISTAGCLRPGKTPKISGQKTQRILRGIFPQSLVHPILQAHSGEICLGIGDKIMNNRDSEEVWEDMG
jgi:hypothetical protein